MNKTDTVEIDMYALDVLVDFVVENDVCPPGTEWSELDRMSDDCPGFVSGITCHECWYSSLGIDI